MHIRPLAARAAALLVLILIGCGGGDDGNGKQPTSTPTTVAATATATSQAMPTATPTNTTVPTATATPPAETATASPTVTATATATGTPSLVDELIASGVGRYLGDSTPVETVPNGAWDSLRFDAADAKAICLRGDPYRVEIHHGTNNKVLLYLEGGGACWNNQSCWEAPTAKLTADPLFGAGIFELDNPDNPFKDWNIVYVPYCDGSVFGGDNVADYDGKPHLPPRPAEPLGSGQLPCARSFPAPSRSPSPAAAPAATAPSPATASRALHIPTRDRRLSTTRAPACRTPTTR